ncbi:MAG TPA: arginine deiminase family protein [Blastocatellia bacterium]|nr:arginine deiminase family protein [Blastocatellia bacterium]
MLTAFTRQVSPSLGNCELTFLSRVEIDVSKASAQHRAYERLLRLNGVHVLPLPVEPGLPDAVFVEDTAVVVDEIAVVARMGAATRREEVNSLIPVLGRYRSLRFLGSPATLEGGDVIRVGRTLFVGESTRTNAEGIAQLREFLAPYDYQVRAVKVDGCLHLTTGCSYLGRNVVLLNRSWVDAGPFEWAERIETPASEPWAANTVTVGDLLLLPAGYPRTRELLERRGVRMVTTDISEFEKAEAGLSCLSLIFEDNRRPSPLSNHRPGNS